MSFIEEDDQYGEAIHHIVQAGQALNLEGKQLTHFLATSLEAMLDVAYEAGADNERETTDRRVRKALEEQETLLRSQLGINNDDKKRIFNEGHIAGRLYLASALLEFVGHTNGKNLQKRVIDKLQEQLVTIGTTEDAVLYPKRAKTRQTPV